MRTSGLFLLLALMACASKNDDSAGDSQFARQAIPRTVQVGGATGTIVLGEPLPINPTSDDTIITFPGRDPATGGNPTGAERIHVHLTRPGGNVRSVVFDYLPPVNLDSLIQEIEAQFGTPERSQPQRGGEEPADLAVWRDSRTELRLLRDPNRSAWTIRRELRDLPTKPAR